MKIMIVSKPTSRVFSKAMELSKRLKAKVFFDPTATTIRLVPPSSPDDSTHYIRGDDMGVTYLDPLGREIGYTPVIPPAKN